MDLGKVGEELEERDLCEFGMIKRELENLNKYAKVKIIYRLKVAKLHWEHPIFGFTGISQNNSLTEL